MAVIITHGKPGIGKSPRAVYEIIQRLQAESKTRDSEVSGRCVSPKSLVDKPTITRIDRR